MNPNVVAAALCPTIDAARPSCSANGEAVHDAVELFMEHGCLVIRNAFDPDYVRELHRVFAERYRSYCEDRDFADALSVGNKRTMITIDIDGPFNSPDLYANDFVLAVLKRTLGHELILGGVGCVVSLPGAADQHMHRDHPNIYELAEGEATKAWVDMLLPPYAITVIVPLVPLDATNGTTRFWLGSHLVPKGAAQQMPSVDPVANVGDCLLMDYRLLHGGTANRSEHPRPILYNVYSRRWFRDSRNYRKQQPIRISREQYARIPGPFRYLFDGVQKWV